VSESEREREVRVNALTSSQNKAESVDIRAILSLVFAPKLSYSLTQVQERLTKQIATALNDKLAPHGVGVVIEVPPERTCYEPVERTWHM